MGEVPLEPHLCASSTHWISAEPDWRLMSAKLEQPVNSPVWATASPPSSRRTAPSVYTEASPSPCRVSSSTEPLTSELMTPSGISCHQNQDSSSAGELHRL